MYEYNICNKADENIFLRQCAALENAIKYLRKIELLEDVDGSKIQKYEVNGKEITVFNSNYHNEVYIISEIELKNYF
jgi:hypothetical protein